MLELIYSQERDPVERIRELVGNLRKLEQNGTRLDVSRVEYITPLTILPIASRLARLYPTQPIELVGDSERVEALRGVGFPGGIQNLDVAVPNAVPIFRIRLEAGPAGSAADLLNRLAIGYRNLVVAHLNGAKEIADYYYEFLTYVLSEICDNVIEHAEARSCWIFAKFWPSRGELEFAIVDDGIGIKGRYDKCGFGTQSHVDAMRQAVSGVSSKAPDRGFGLRSTIRAFTSDDLRGSICIISGNACFFREHRRDTCIGTIGVHWPGLVYCGRVYRPKHRVSMIPFAEG